MHDGPRRPLPVLPHATRLLPRAPRAFSRIRQDLQTRATPPADPRVPGASASEAGSTPAPPSLRSFEQDTDDNCRGNDRTVDLEFQEFSGIQKAFM